MQGTVTILGYLKHSDIQLVCSMMELKVIPFPRHFGVPGLVQIKYSGLVSVFFRAGVGFVDGGITLCWVGLGVIGVIGVTKVLSLQVAENGIHQF